MRYERDSRRLIQRLTREGWEQVKVRGSHHQFRHPTIPGKVSVPHPKRDLTLKTAKSIYFQAGWLAEKEAE